MKKFNLWLLLSLFVSAFMFTACSSSDDATSGGEGQGGGGDVPGVTTGYTISGVIKSGMAAVGGVKVTAGASSVITGLNGMFTLENVSGSVVKFEKEGFATITRPITGDASYEVTLTSVNTETFPATSAKTLDVDWTGMKVDLPASFKDESGNAYTGTVTAKSAYLTPDDAQFSTKMPGDLTAIRTDQSEAALISYGMISVELTGDAGQKLQPGSPATLTFPVPSGVDPAQFPTIPLWQFNEETGIWEEEGEAAYDGGLNAYVGIVNHFSWHNLDYPYSRATLNVKVVDANGKALSGIYVDYDGQRTVWTNANGVATCTVPSGTPMVIRIPSESYCGYANAYDNNGNYTGIDEKKIVKQENVTLTGGETKTITLTMPYSAVISGKVTDASGNPQQCALWIQYGSDNTVSVISNKNGEYTLYAPYVYRGAAKVIAFCGDGYQQETAIILDGKDQTLDIIVDRDNTQETGVVYIKGEGINMNLGFDVPESGIFENSVYVKGNDLNAYLWGGQKAPGMSGIANTSLDINIPDYDPTKTSFSGYIYLRWAVWTATAEDWYHVSSSPARTSDSPVLYVPIEVVKTGEDIYTFKITGVDAFYGVDRYDETNPAAEIPVKVTATFTAKESK